MKQLPRRRKPVLRIDVLELAPQSSKIKLIRPDGSEDTIDTLWGHSNLDEYFERYHQGLRNFKERLQNNSLEQDFRVLTDAFIKLFMTGKALFDELFADRMREVATYLGGYIAAFDYIQRPVGVIEVRTSTFNNVFPIECLVIPGSEPKVQSLPDLAQAASGILGFSFVINRVVERTNQRKKEELNNTPQLPVKYFYSKELGTAEAELDFFRKKQKRYFKLDGPWPEEHTETLEEDFVRYLFRPDIRFSQDGKTGSSECYLDEIHHLSCHCVADVEHSWKTFLELIKFHPIELGTMEAHLADLKARSERQTEIEMPLVFFNACSSSIQTPKGMISFPKYFLIKNGNCGFIGSEINVPDRFANEFCQQFYLYLIKGSGVGEAIFWARRKMLERYNNPLGILYTSYVDPYLRVKNPMDHN
jgi:hypothetical protein